MGWVFVPLDDVSGDPEAVVARLLEVAGDQEDDDQDEDSAVPWHVRVSRKLQGDQGVWGP